MNPYITLSGQEIQVCRYEMKAERVIIGRQKDNDISLEPDPQQLVTRHMHCSIEKRKNIYWLIDNASKNGTLLMRGMSTQRIVGEIKLQNQDVILILSKIDPNGEPAYWKLQFIDPQATEDVEKLIHKKYLEYDWIQAKLYLVSDTIRTEIKGLTPQEHKLIRYMEQRNRNNGNSPVMCTYEELITAIWEDQYQTHIRNDILRLIWSLRKKIEPDPKNSMFLINVKGMGYRFIINSII